MAACPQVRAEHAVDDGADVAWHVEYLRERLATMPAEGYGRWGE